MGHRLDQDRLQRVEGDQRRTDDAGAVPVYFWARRVASRAYALLACAHAVDAGLVYTGMLMTENAFFPAFVLASFAIALA